MLVVFVLELREIELEITVFLQKLVCSGEGVVEGLKLGVTLSGTDVGLPL